MTNVTLTAEQAQQIEEALAEPAIEEMTLTQIAARHDQAAKKSVERHVENVYERGDKYFAWIGDNYVQIYTASVRTKDLTDELQQKCSDWGTYWRAPDAHGVNLSIEQATELLRDALGVEVEITPPIRTKDLTDDEIMKINVDTASIVPTCDRQFHFARAVIQEFRRKNGIV